MIFDVDKISLKNEQLWISLRDKNGDYVGTWHVTDKETASILLEIKPKELEVTQTHSGIAKPSKSKDFEVKV